MAAKKSAPRARRPSDAALVERLRKICLALPGANERVSHGEPTWFAGKGKVFAMLDNHHHGSEHLSVWLPLPFGIQETLVASDTERYFRPPYVGSSGWVGVVLDSRPDWPGVATLVREAYVHVAPRKLVSELNGASATATATRPRKRAPSS
jgi:predicted DNA-binding protein (MmcQ/YjbR family)